jgi:DNA-binding transcriptional LysR family regulator
MGAKMRPGLTLRQVDVFRAIVKFGTVTAAAAALGSSQPTLTRELLRLEATVGFQLFERRRQRLHPTARALKLYHAIEEAYSGLDKINASLLRMRSAYGEILQVSTLPTFAQSLLPEAVARLHSEAPGLTIEIDNGDPRNQSPISGFNFDLGLIEGEYDDPTTEVIPLGRFRQVCLIPAGHPLASGEGPLNLQDFEDHAFVSLGPKDPYRMILDRMFDEAGVTRRLPVTMQSANAVCEMVRSGLGVSILNPLTALGYLGDRVVLRGFAQAPGFVVSALHPADRPWVDSAGRLAGHLRAVCAETQQRLQALRLA